MYFHEDPIGNKLQNFHRLSSESNVVNISLILFVFDNTILLLLLSREATLHICDPKGLHQSPIIIDTTPKLIAKRHHGVSSSLALLLWCCKDAESSRAAAPTGDKVQ